MLPYALLFLSTAAIGCAWLPPRLRLAGSGAAVAGLAATGLWSGILAPVATVWLLTLFATAWWAARGGAGRILAWALFVAFALGIGFGLLPGFSPVMLTEPTPIKPGSAPYGLRFGLGKPLAGVAMLLWLVPVTYGRGAWSDLLRRTAPAIAATAAAVLLSAWGIGYVRLAPGVPSLPFALAWAATNLMLTCTVEEAFFRGLVQRGLARIMPPQLAIALAALLFGLAHFAGGWTYMALAGIAGVGYGVAYQRSGGRIEAAILTHFAVNLSHFALFTYPAWAPMPPP